MRLSRLVLAIAVGPILGCASTAVDVERVPLCASVAELPPQPAAGSCDEQALAEYTSALSERIVKPESQALVRVEFDETARARSFCVDEGVGSHAWLERRHLAAQPNAIANLPPGPRCLAHKRIDLNRYEATLAEIDHAAKTQCAMQNRHFQRCMARAGDWIMLGRIGWMRPFLFVAPEVANPPDLSSIDTKSRCARTTHRFEAEAECIQADGWEMLAPPAR